MRYQLAVPFVVFACAVGATVAYQRAQPAPRPGTAGGPEPGFAMVTVDEVGRLANATAAIHRRRIEEQQLVRGGRSAAAAWLRAIPAGGPPAPAVFAPPASTGVARLRTWLDGLPAVAVTYEPLGAELERPPDEEAAAPPADPAAAGAPPLPAVTVRGSLVVKLHQARDTSRSERLPVQLTMRAATLRGPWTVSEATVRLRRGVGSYQDPILVRTATVDVVAEAAQEAFARSAATEATAALVQLRRRYPQVVESKVVTLYVVPGSKRVQLLFPDRDLEVSVHPTGWTYDDGDVVLLWNQLAGSRPVRRTGIVRHELVHAAMLPLFTAAPTLIFEGVATFEETRRIGELSSLALDLRPLQAAFREGRLGYRELLRSTEPDFGRDGEPAVQLGYLASYATIAFMEEEFGHPTVQRLLTLLRSGVAVDDALRRTVRLSPLGLERRVRVWTRERLDGAA